MHPRAAVAVLLLSAACTAAPPPPALDPAEIRAIAKDAYIYGFPLADNYRVIHANNVDTADPGFAAPVNVLKNYDRVSTPEDRTVQTPNSDTPYSRVLLDLRAEPMVLTLPAIERGRYYSVQLIDLYTHNFAYLGSRTTGNGGGSFLIAGPGWTGAKPAGITEVVSSETQLAKAIFRTQLFAPSDIENVKRIQAGYKVQPLSAFLGTPAPAAAAPIAFIAPLAAEELKQSPDIFRVVNFVLQYCPTHPSEQDLMARFAKIGVGAGLPFDAATLPPEVRRAVEDGIADAQREFAALLKRADAGEVTSGDLFGTREYLRNNYLYRMAGDVLGIYGNTKEEAIYPAYRVDADGKPLDGATGRYTIRFAPGQLPPANAFWSLTMYELPSSLLSANPIDRYLINSPMLPQLRKDADGGITLHVQPDSPGKGRESNWLPAPKGPFWIALRIYWPKPAALDGTWQQPPLRREP